MKRKKNSLIEIIPTKDGSYTLYSSLYQESYHSLEGAITEARERFIQPCKIAQLALQKKEISILDIGYGLGFNICATLWALREVNFGGFLRVISLEKDDQLLQKIPQIPPPPGLELDYSIVQNLASCGEVKSEKFHLELVVAPAEKSIEILLGSFDAVFLDPFSPKKNPELWTVDFFENLYRLMSREAVLSTYSSAIWVKLNLMSVGFCMGQGPRVTGKSSGTLASKEEDLPPFPERHWRKLQRRFLREFGRPYKVGSL